MGYGCCGNGGIRLEAGKQMKAVVEVTWILAAIPGSQMVGDFLHLRDGSRIPITVLTESDEGIYVSEIGGFANDIGA